MLYSLAKIIFSNLQEGMQDIAVFSLKLSHFLKKRIPSYEENEKIRSHQTGHFDNQKSSCEKSVIIFEHELSLIIYEYKHDDELWRHEGQIE